MLEKTFGDLQPLGGVEISTGHRMAKFQVTREAAFKVDQLFAIAADVDSYRHFVPLVKESSVMNRRAGPDGVEYFDALLTISSKKLRIRESFVSQVEVDRANYSVRISSSDGPIKNMVSQWQMRSLPNGRTEVNYQVDYALKSRTLQFLMSSIFDLAMRKVLAAFEERARQLYGARAA